MDAINNKNMTFVYIISACLFIICYKYSGVTNPRSFETTFLIIYSFIYLLIFFKNYLFQNSNKYKEYDLI